MSVKTECGLISILVLNPIKKNNLYYSLSEIQHRGQDSYGLVISSKDKNVIIKENGLVPDSLDIEVTEYPSMVIGHVRYATSKLVQTQSTLQSPNSFGEKLTNSLKRFSFSSSTSSISSSSSVEEDPKQCIQPLEICNNNKIYLSHNGNLFNIKENSLKLDINTRLRYPSDTYVFKYIWEQHFSYNNTKTEMIAFIKNIICTIPGAYSCVVTFYDKNHDEFFMWGFRDRYGYKPLSIGKIDNNYCFISETIQIENSKDFITDVLPGEVYEISSKTNKIPKLVYNYNSKYVNHPFFCSMEAIYFMKKESLLFNGLLTVHEFRRKLGYELAKQELTYDFQQDIKKMVVTYVPESARSICIGYSEMMSTLFKDNIITKIENIRSFIESSTESRNGKIKRKFWFNEEEIKKSS
jgi:amidophosphoribosyltransferase